MTLADKPAGEAVNADGSVRALGGYTEITGASGERQIRFAAKVSF